MFQICPKREAKEIFERKISRINSIHYTHTKRLFKKRKREKERKEKEKSVRDDCVVVVVVFVLRALVFEDEYE